MTDDIMDAENTKKPSRFGRRLMIGYLVLFLFSLTFLGGMVVGMSSEKAEEGSEQVELEVDLQDLQEDEVILEDFEAGEVLKKKTMPAYLEEDIDFSLYWDVWSMLREKYVDQPVAETQMLYGSLFGMVASLGDPYTIFFDPESAAAFNEELGGSFEGIGAEIAVKEGQLVVVAPLSGSPAEKAGLETKDVILAVDGEDTAGMTVHEAVLIIRGEAGTTVVLTVRREGVLESFDIPIIRGRIIVDSMTWKMIGEENNIAHIKVRSFNSDAKTTFNRIVMEINGQKPQAVILDLRNNPGGFLDAAIDMASEWIEKDVVMIEEDGQGLQREFRSNGLARLQGYPTVVLVNNGSASGSEIVAGALQDHDKAAIVGEQTFGKGSVQTLEKLKDGSALKFTTARWLTPDGRVLDHEGVTPDHEVELTKEDFDADRDPQLGKALELLQESGGVQTEE